jgi:NAD(P)-dependent dehydrogenase (short-subunit alcohol dehydrogenase family)
MKLAGKTAVVTGAASGIGSALVRALAAAGARRVVGVDRDEAGAREVAASVGGSIGTGLRADVSSAEEVAGVVDRIERDVGPIDLFCSNAGILVPGGPEALDRDWQKIWEVNVMAHVWAARALVPRMIERGGGAFLNTASAAGLLTQIGSAPYAVTKHAAVAFAEWLAITYGEQGIQVAVLCPQAVRTRMTEGIENGGVAGVDGMLEPDAVAAAAIAGLEEDRFLVLPHPTVETYFRRKADDYERWIRGMRRLQERFGKLGGMSDPTQNSPSATNRDGGNRT